MLISAILLYLHGFNFISFFSFIVLTAAVFRFASLTILLAAYVLTFSELMGFSRAKLTFWSYLIVNQLSQEIWRQERMEAVAWLR